MKMVFSILVLLVFLSGIGNLPSAQAKCLPSSDEIREIKVRDCFYYDPSAYDEMVLRKVDELRARYVDMSSKSNAEEQNKRMIEMADQQREDILKSYYGALVIADDGKPSPNCPSGSLSCYGTDVKHFLPTQNKNACEGFPKGEILRLLVGKACCDGDPNPPCWLEFSNLIKGEPGYDKLTCREDSDCVGVHGYVPPRRDLPGETLISCRHKTAPLRDGEWLADESWNMKCTCHKEKHISWLNSGEGYDPREFFRFE